MKTLFLFATICCVVFANQIQTQNTYLGCFIDNSSRDLPSYQGGGFYVETCIDKCKSIGYRYAGLQFHQECWCGNEYGTFGQTEESDCSFNCIANPSQKCGASWRNNIYDANPVPTASYTEKSTRLGCFEDKSSRDLINFPGSGFSIEKCLEKCYSTGYKYAGVQYFSECWCDNDYGMYGQKPDADCNLNCTTGGGTCGGHWRNEVYTLSSNLAEVEVEKICGVAFTQCQFQGESFEFCTDVETSGLLFKSFKVPEGHSAFAFNQDVENSYQYDSSVECVNGGFKGILLKEQ